MVHNVESVAGLSGMKATHLRGFNGGVFSIANRRETGLGHWPTFKLLGTFIPRSSKCVCNMCAEIHPKQPTLEGRNFTYLEDPGVY